MRTEFVSCDAPHCDARLRMGDAYEWLRIHVQAPGKKFWADLCSRECAVAFFREGGTGASEEIEGEIDG